MAIVSGNINNGITLGTAGAYASPLTVTSTGYVDNSSTSGNGIYGPGTQPWLVYNYGRIREAGTGTAQAGIFLSAGGTVVNAATGTIAGAGKAVYLGNGGGTISNSGIVINYGRMAATYGAGVQLGAGGSVSNGISGSISGTIGVDILGGTGTITNSGTIIGTTPGSSVYLGRGGSVANTGLIGNFDEGLTIERAAGTVTNSGSIYGTYLDGLRLARGGSVTNMFGGRISGALGLRIEQGGSIDNAGVIAGNPNSAAGVWFSQGNGVVINRTTGIISGRYGVEVAFAAVGTVVNYGTITGRTQAVSAAGVFLNNGGSVINNAGGVISGEYGILIHPTRNDQVYRGLVGNAGTIVGSGGLAAIDITLGGTVGNIGGLITGAGADGIDISNGLGTVINTGTIIATGDGIVLGSGGTVTDEGAILAAGGTAINFGGNVANRLVVGSAYVLGGKVLAGVGASNTLELEASAAAGHISGLGSKFTNFSTLVFDSGARWTAEGAINGIPALINGFAIGDTIDLDGFVAVSHTFANNALVLTDTANNQATLGIQGNFSTANFIVAADGAGGTDVTLRPTPMWIGGNGNWNTGTDWNTGSPPAPGADATIANGALVTITNSIDVNSITVDSPLSVAAAGATVTVAGNLTTYAGVAVDRTSGSGGSTVKIGGTFGPNGFAIGNTALSAPTTVTLGADTGFLGNYLFGNVANNTTNQATLYIQTAAPQTFNAVGPLYIEGDALLEFASGSFSSITNGKIYLQGPQARIANTAEPNSSSALSGLSSNAGTLILDDHASLTTSAGLDFTNNGVIEADDGASISFGGTLNNANGFIEIYTQGRRGPSYVGGTTTITAQTLAGNRRIFLYDDDSSHQSQAVLNIGGPAPTVLMGQWELINNSLIEFGSSTISTVGTASTLELSGANARIITGGNTAGNSALTGLASNAGTMTLDNGAQLSISTPTFTNSGALLVDRYIGGSSRLAFQEFVNTGFNVQIGNAHRVPATSNVTATSLVNSGEMKIEGVAYNGVTVGPMVTINGASTNSDFITVYNIATFDLAGRVSGSGTIRIEGSGAVVEFGAAVDSTQHINIYFGGGPTKYVGPTTIKLDDPSAFAAVVNGLSISNTITPNSQIDLTTISNDSILSAALNTTTDVLTVVTNSSLPLSVQLSGTYTAGTAVLHQVDAGGTGSDIFLSFALCFCRGTMIRAERGEVPIETLAIGDRVATLIGAMKPIVWIGVGRDLVTRANRLARPVIVRQGALADNVPARDLYLTHGHSLYLNGVLIPVEHLINHHTILWDDTARVVEYYHIELEDHEVVWANGAAAETYYDASNRALFQNVRAGSAAAGAGKPTYAPVETRGAVVEHIWAELFARTGAQIDTATTADPDLHLIADDKRIDAMSTRDGVHVFSIAHPPIRAIQLRSRFGVPSLLGLNRHEHRRLGVALRQIIVNARGLMTCLDADAPILVEGGCHPAENGFCWTDGMVSLPAAAFAHIRGAFTLLVHTSDEGMRYPLAEEVRLAA